MLSWRVPLELKDRGSRRNFNAAIYMQKRRNKCAKPLTVGHLLASAGAHFLVSLFLKTTNKMGPVVSKFQSRVIVSVTNVSITTDCLSVFRRIGSFCLYFDRLSPPPPSTQDFLHVDSRRHDVSCTRNPLVL